MNGCLFIVLAIFLLWAIITALYSWVGLWGTIGLLVLWYILASLDG